MTTTMDKSKERFDLDEIRQKINDIDQSLLQLLAERRQVTAQVAESKLQSQRAVRDEQREVDLLRKLSQIGAGLGLEQQYIGKIFGLIIEDSLARQKRLLHQHANDGYSQQSVKVAILGGQGAYSHLAAVNYFGIEEFAEVEDNEDGNSEFENPEARIKDTANEDNQWSICSSFQQLVDKVVLGDCEFGVLPIENTSSGAINDSYDLLEANDIYIVGEEKYAINHCLLSAREATINGLQTIYAHPQAALQCKKWLQDHSDIRLETVESSAHALAKVKQTGATSAAIAGKDAASHSGLLLLQEEIADFSHNATRFVVLSRQPCAVPLNLPAKVSLVLTTGQQPGALADILQIFKTANITLSKLESRPIPGKAWEQRFYLDLEGNLAEPNVSETLDKVSAACRSFRLLGCYVNADLSNTRRSVERVAFS